jgi:iron complex outermembrane receptor protein
MIMKISKKIVSIGSPLCLLVGAGLTLGAHGDDHVARRSTDILMEEVVVSARKKSALESAQKVPVAVTALTGAQIEAKFLQDLTDVGYKAPNVRLYPAASAPLYANFQIRGMGLRGSLLSDDPTVGIFLDGVYLGVPAGSVVNTFDVASVEILRGPQGTLFGRNVTGGAVLINTTRPTYETGGKVKATIGSDEFTELAFNFGGTLVEDKLAGSLAVIYSDQGDTWENIDAVGEDLGEQELLVVRPKLLFDVTENLSFTLLGEFGEAKSDPGVRRAILESGKSVVEDSLERGLPVPSLHSTKVAVNFTPKIDTEWTQITLEGMWRLGEDSSIKSISAWREFEQSPFANDIDGTSIDFFRFDVNSYADQDQLSQEFIYSTPFSDRIDFAAGLYYFEQDYTYAEHRTLIEGAVTQFGAGKVSHSTWGVFANGDVQLTDKLTLNLGARYTKEKKEASVASRGSDCTGITIETCEFKFQDEETWDNVTPKIGLQYFLNDDTQFYVSLSRGFRSGGFNVRNVLPASPGPYDEEVVDAYEVGVKTEYWDGKARTNIAIFYNEFDDLQRTVNDGAGNQQILNAATATVSGVELETSFLFADSFLLTAAVGYADTEFNDYDADNDGRPEPELDGNQFASVPEWTANLEGTYDISMKSGVLSLSASYVYTDEFFAADTNGLVLDGHELINAAATYKPNTGNWSASLYGRNIADEIYGTASFELAPFDNMEMGPRRSYGLSVTFDF